ncbi:MAG: TrbC/VirB2 family protein [Pseudomonadota bacterium]
MFNDLITERDFYWRLMAVFCMGAVILASSDAAFAAATSNSNDVIGQTLCRVTQTLTGNIAKSIATIAIFVVGISLFMGKVNWGTAAMTAAGVGIIFGAGKMVSFISGTDSVCSTSTS